MLAYRLFYLWTEGDTESQSSTSTTLLDNQDSRSLLGFLLGRHAVEALGVPLGLCISRFVTAAAPSVLEALPNQQQQEAPYQYPASFYVAAALSALELLAFVRTALTTPGGYALHIDASFPVGAAFFLFVWASDRNMRRGLDDAKLTSSAAVEGGVAHHRLAAAVVEDAAVDDGEGEEEGDVTVRVCVCVRARVCAGQTYVYVCCNCTFNVRVLPYISNAHNTQVARLLELDGMGVEALCTVRPRGDTGKPTPYKVGRWVGRWMLWGALRWLFAGARDP